MKGDMTKGRPMKILITFTIPIIISNLLQQLYNTSDAIIAGKFVGKNALAAVGVASPIMSIAIFLILGLCMGASLLIAKFFGANELKLLKSEFSTTLVVGTIFTIVISAICVLLSSQILILINTPVEIFMDANLFLKIIFGGLIFSFLFNFFSSALQAIGDSTTPFIFLAISSVLNVILGIIFTGILELGVAGTATATVAAQAISSMLCIVYVYIKVPMLRVKRNEWIIDKCLLKKTVNYSWALTVQLLYLCAGRLLIQRVVNTLGTDTIAVYNAISMVDAFVFIPGDSLTTSVATYSAQNLGAGKVDRIIKGFKKSNVIVILYSIVVSLIVFFTARSIIQFFVSASEIEVISVGEKYLKIMSVFYILSGVSSVFQGLFRGIARFQITLTSMIIQISVRVILVYILVPRLGIPSICYAIAVGWFLTLIYQGLSYRKYLREQASL